MRYFSVLFTFLVFTHLSFATTIDVPGDSATIQAGINGAVNGDTVLVASGTYYERNIDFLRKEIVVKSQDGPRYAFVKSPSDTNDTLDLGFYFHNGETRNSKLIGFSITDFVCREGELFAIEGGGIYIDNSHPCHGSD